MSKQRPAQAAGTEDEYPSAAALAELQTLTKKRVSKKERARRVWEILTVTRRQVDHGVLIDFALENNLVASCGVERKDIPGPVGQTTSWVNPIDESEMIWIPPGPFLVGRDRERAHSDGFSLARYPVTNRQFKAFLDATGYEPAEDHPLNELFLSHWNNGKIPRGREDHPVVWVSFVDALAYCRWAGLHLPTEWLWEKAARGPDGRDYPWGDSPPQIGRPDRGEKLAHIRTDATCAVGKFSKVRTPYGCEDLIGNVSEWCQMIEGTNYGLMPTEEPVVPPLPERQRADEEQQEGPLVAVRGSCFMRFHFRRMVAWHRRRLSPYRRNYWVGFRPAFLCAWRPGEE
jgi:serine/threonine-protein kinase